MRLWSLVGLFALVAGAAVGIGCQDYSLQGPGDWQPADQPEQLGETYLEDEFIQRTAEASDILFVVDNSCSMYEEQAALQANFWNFIQFFVNSGMDYHIGITVLDDYAGQPPIGQLYGSTRYIDNTTPDPVGAFTGNMTMGDDGMGQCEVGLDASMKALTEPLLSGYNTGFYREEAFLLLVIVSDEPDTGVVDPMNCPGFIPLEEYIPWLTTLKGAQGLDRIHFAVIGGDLPDGCTGSWGDADPALGYADVVEALAPDHSTFFSICEQDWSPVMTDLGLEAVGLLTTFHLTQVPVPGTLEVTLDPDGAGPIDESLLDEDPSYQTPGAYVYDAVGNAIVFSPETAPPEGAVLRANFEPQI